MRILVQDRSMLSRKNLINGVSNLGFNQIFELSSRQEDISIYLDFDILFLEVDIGDESNFEFVKQLNQIEGKKPKIIALSTDLAMLPIEEIEKYGLIDAIQKPINRAQLAASMVNAKKAINTNQIQEEDGRIDSQIIKKESDMNRFIDVFNQMSVLIVDDEDGVRRALKRRMERFFKSVYTAEDGENAIKMVTDGQKGIDLIITDINMPNVNGIEMATNIKKVLPEIPIIFITGERNPEYMMEALNAISADGFLLKPFPEEQFCRLMQKVANNYLSRDEKIESDIKAQPSIEDEQKQKEQQAKSSEPLEVTPIPSEPDAPLKETIEEYFAECDTLATILASYLKKQKRYNFSKFKKFLLSAYNTLTEMDPNIMDEQLIAAKKRLDTVYTRYQKYTETITKPIQQYFHEVFLEKQAYYRTKIKEMEMYEQKADEYDLMLQEREKEALALTQNIERLKKTGAKSIEHENALKEVNMRLLDAQKWRNDQKSKSISIAMDIESFRGRFEEEFRLVFFERARYHIDRLHKIVDTVAYELNYLLWKKARRSDEISYTIEEFGIKGAINARNFLEFYLDRSDTDTISQQDKDFLEYLAYLDKNSKKSILILGKTQESVVMQKSTLEILDKNYKAYGSIHFEGALDMAVRYKINYLIVEYGLNGGRNGIEFIKSLKERGVLLDELDVCMLFSNPTKSMLEDAKKEGIVNVMRHPKSKGEFEEKIVEFL